MTKRWPCGLLVFPLLLTGPAYSQGETGFLRGKGKLDFELSNSHDDFEEQIGQGAGSILAVDRNEQRTWFGYGITDELDLGLSISYASAEFRDFDVVPEEDDFQDVNLYLKYKALAHEFGAGELSFLLEPGISFPTTDYEDEGRLALGGGQVNLKGRFIVHWVPRTGGYFLSVESGYDWRREAPPNEIPVNVTLGFKALGRFWLQPFYSYTDKLADSDDSGASDPFGQSFFSSSDDIERYGIKLYVDIDEHLGLTYTYRVTDDDRPSGAFPGWTFGIVLRR